MPTSQTWFFLALAIGMVTIVIAAIARRCYRLRRRMARFEAALLSSGGRNQQEHLNEAFRHFRIDARHLNPNEQLTLAITRCRESSQQHAIAAAVNGAVTIPLVLLTLSCTWLGTKARATEEALAVRSAAANGLADTQLDLLRLFQQGWANGFSRLTGDLIVHGDAPAALDGAEQRSRGRMETTLERFVREYEPATWSEREAFLVGLARACLAAADADYEQTVRLLTVERPKKEDHLQPGRRDVATSLLCGDACYSLRDWESASDRYREAVGEGEDRPEIEARLTAGYLQMMMPEEAIAALEPMVVRRRIHREADDSGLMACMCGNLGVGTALQGRPDQALKFLDQAVRMTEEQAQREMRASAMTLAVALNNRGNVALSLGKPTAALEDFSRAIGICDEQIEAVGETALVERRFRLLQCISLSDRASVRRTVGRFDVALIDTTRALEKLEIVVRGARPRKHDLLKAGILALKALILSDLDRLQEALAAIELAENLGSSTDGFAVESQVVSRRAACLGRLGRSLAAAGDKQRARDRLEQAAALYETLADNRQIRGYILPRLAAIHVDLAEVFLALERLDTARDRYEEAIQCYSEVIDTCQQNQYRSRLAGCLDKRGDLFRDAGLYESLEDTDAAIEIYRQLLREEDATNALEDLANSLNNRGVTLSRLKQLEKAVEAYSEAIDCYRRIADSNRRNEIDLRLATALNNRGVAFRGLKRYEDAVSDYGLAIELRSRLEEEGSPEVARDLANSLNNRAIGRRHLQQIREALADHNRAVEVLTHLVEIEHLSEYAPELAAHLGNRGNTLFLTRRYEAALHDFERAAALNSDLALRGGRIEPVQNLVISLSNLAQAYATCPDRSLRSPERAVKYAERAAELTNWLDPRVLERLALAHHESGNAEEAVRWQAKALELAAEDRKATLRETLARYREDIGKDD